MAWDAYPMLHGADSWRTACQLAFTHDLYRSMKGGLPFILMESTPSSTNWAGTPMLKKPGPHQQEMLLAIGHGADSSMYFQWRKSRGAFEKFHGAVVDHEGGEETRVFKEVAAHGASLKKLDGVVGTTVRPEVALLFDYFAESPNARRVATLRLMKFMSDFREAMWGVVQTAVSELDFDFADYRDKHFDRMLSTGANPDFDTWLREASEPAS